MNKFKVGDKVKCIDNASGTFNLTIGRIYEVLSIGSSSSMFETFRDNGEKEWYFTERFELVEPYQTLEEQINIAKSFKNKKINWNDNVGQGEVIGFALYHKDDKNSKCHYVSKYLETHDICVALKLTNGGHIPYSIVTLNPEFTELKLNDNYTAKIYKDKVEVGCQIFPIEVVKELIKLNEKFINSKTLD